MAIITEEDQNPKSHKKQSETTKTRKPPTTQNPTKPQPQPQNPFTFWFYFTIIVSLITLLFASISSLTSSQDPKSWFISLPEPLRQHYSNGRIIKVQTSPNQAPIEVFLTENGPSASENVLFVHGLGLSSYAFRSMIRSLGSKGVHVIAIDLPGNGFSDKSREVIEEEKPTGVLGFKEVYDLIREKGIFWAFDQMIETGQIPYEEIMRSRLNRKSMKPIDLGSNEMGRVLGQVIQTKGLAPVHLVLHDSALAMSANFVSENSNSIRSVTLIDAGVGSALPLWVMGIPVIREVVSGFSFLYGRLIRSCCSKQTSLSELEAHMSLLKAKDGRAAIVGMGRKLNSSFDVAEWGGLSEIKGMPIQVLWSDGWSKEWSEEGKRVGKAIPHASFATHSGGRWPQEDAAEEIAERIARFVSSLPKSIRKVEEEPIPEHIQKMFDEAKETDHDHDHGSHHDHQHHGHAHAHPQGAGYMDAYGLGQEWGG